jgi:serine protease
MQNLNGKIMKQTHSMHTAALTRCATLWLALASLPTGAAAGSQEPQSILETDRVIVKYRDAQPAANGSTVIVEGGSSARKARLDRAGQQFGVLVRESHALANGARCSGSIAGTIWPRCARWRPR